MKKIIYTSLFSLFGMGVFVQNVLAQTSANEKSTESGEIAVAVIGAMMIFGVSVVYFLFIGMILIVSILGTVLWIWMIIDAAKNEKNDDLLVWILILVFLQFIGAVVYYFVRKRPRDQKKKNGGVSVS